MISASSSAVGFEVHRCIGEEQGPPFGEHDVHAGDLFHAGLGADDVQGRADGIRVIAAEPADHAIGLAVFQQHAAEVVRSFIALYASYRFTPLR